MPIVQTLREQYEVGKVYNGTVFTPNFAKIGQSVQKFTGTHRNHDEPINPLYFPNKLG
jgi:hypothetical protein